MGTRHYTPYKISETQTEPRSLQDKTGTPSGLNQTLFSAFSCMTGGVDFMCNLIKKAFQLFEPVCTSRWWVTAGEKVEMFVRGIKPGVHGRIPHLFHAGTVHSLTALVSSVQSLEHSLEAQLSSSSRTCPDLGRHKTFENILHSDASCYVLFLYCSGMMIGVEFHSSQILVN